MRKIQVIICLLFLTSGSAMAAVLSVTSPAFQNNHSIPKEYTGEGRDISPALAWGGAPPVTKSFVLICDDPDASSGTWVHWVLFNIPVTTTSLPTAAKGVGREGSNSWQTLGYRGPMPPPGSGPHRYVFTLYALDTMLDLPVGATKLQLLRAMQGHIVAQTQLVGRYER